jgi:acyl transferase domain-containing protein
MRSELAPAVNNSTSTGPQLILVSANTQESLKKQVANVQQYVSSHPDRIADISYTLAQRREHLPHRSFFLAGKEVEATDAAPAAKIPANPAAIAMIFSGQGAQWPEMGADLIKTDLKFREDIQEMDKMLKSLIHPPSWTIEGTFYDTIPRIFI